MPPIEVIVAPRVHKGGPIGAPMMQCEPSAIDEASPGHCWVAFISKGNKPAMVIKTPIINTIHHLLIFFVVMLGSLQFSEINQNGQGEKA